MQKFRGEPPKEIINTFGACHLPKLKQSLHSPTRCVLCPEGSPMTTLPKLTVTLLLVVTHSAVLSLAPSKVHNELRVANRNATFTPFDLLDLTAAGFECSIRHNIPPELFQLYQRGIFPNEPITWCFVRCVALKMDVYCDSFGPDLDKLGVQFDAHLRSKSKFKKTSHSCVSKKLAKLKDTCERAYQSLIGCFGTEIRQLLRGGQSAPRVKDSCDECYRLFDELYQASIVQKRESTS